MQWSSRGVCSAWWYVRTALMFALSEYQWQKGTMYGALSQLSYLWDLDKQEQKGVGDAQKSSFGDGDASHKRETLFIGKAGSHYVILLYCETLMQVLLRVYCKTKVFFRIHLFTMLLLFYVFEVGKAKGATQSVLMILTLNGFFQKKI